MKTGLLACAIIALSIVALRAAGVNRAESEGLSESMPLIDASPAFDSRAAALESSGTTRSKRDAASPETSAASADSESTEVAKVASIPPEAGSGDYSWLDELTPQERHHLLEEVTIEYNSLSEEPIARKWSIGDYIVIPSFNSSYQTDERGRYLPNSIRLVDGEVRLVRLRYDENPAASERFSLMAEIRKRPLPERETLPGHLAPEVSSIRQNR